MQNDDLLGMGYMFKCKKCGYCCSNLDISTLYSDLDRGDGVCKYFDEKTRLCSIYETRPEKCRVDLMYELHFKSEMTIDEYYQRNYDACNKIKEIGRKPKCI